MEKEKNMNGKECCSEAPYMPLKEGLEAKVDYRQHFVYASEKTIPHNRVTHRRK